MNLSENNLILPIFPEAVLYMKKIDVNSNEIINHLKNLKFFVSNASLNGEADCSITETFNLLDDLPFLKEKISEQVNFYLHKIFFYKMNYHFSTSWATKTNFKGFSQKHVHSNSFLSGVYYPIGNKNFKIKFYKKLLNIWSIEKEKLNEFNIKEITLEIHDNNILILFPSDLEHNIVNNEENIERYSIAFNINPKGLIGKHDSGIVF